MLAVAVNAFLKRRIAGRFLLSKNSARVRKSLHPAFAELHNANPLAIRARLVANVWTPLSKPRPIPRGNIHLPCPRASLHGAPHEDVEVRAGVRADFPIAWRLPDHSDIPRPLRAAPHLYGTPPRGTVLRPQQGMSASEARTRPPFSVTPLRRCLLA